MNLWTKWIPLGILFLMNKGSGILLIKYKINAFTKRSPIRINCSRLFFKNPEENPKKPNQAYPF
jgi:hypothetical protein